MREPDQVVDLGLEGASGRDCVQFHLQSRGQSRVDPRQDLLDAAKAGDGAVAGRIERVERDIDAGDATGNEVASVARELSAVGGEGQLVERAGAEMARQTREQAHYIAAHQGLAPGDPDFGHASADELLRHQCELLEAQELGAWRKVHALRHAVGAAQIATVGDRQAQICDLPTEPVDHRAGPAIKRHYGPPSGSAPRRGRPGSPSACRKRVRRRTRPKPRHRSAGPR